MDNNFQELYQDIILEHNRNPHNKCPACKDSICQEGYNPSCGDEVQICIKFKDNVIEKITFSGEGCAISQASASLMTDLLLGKTRQDAIQIIYEVSCSLNGASSDLSKYGEVCALSGVKTFPMRVKCATLAWHAADLILKNQF